MTRRIILAALVGVLVSGPVSASAAENDLMLVCRAGSVIEAYYILQPTKGKAKLVSVDPANEGKLEVKENIFIIRFPPTKGGAENWVRVNRYTGEYEIEFGAPPFFKYRKGNSKYVGSCTKTKPKRRF